MSQEALVLKNIPKAPLGGFTKYEKGEHVTKLPLNVTEIRKNYFDGLITLEEAVRLIYDWRYFNIRSVHKKIETESDETTYVYCTLPKRGNRKSVLNTWNHGLIKIAMTFLHERKETSLIIQNEQQYSETQFLKITCTGSPDYPLNEWNAEQCAKEINLFKKRIRNRFGQTTQFIRSDEVHKNGYIHVNLICIFPEFRFTVFEHYSKKKRDRYGQSYKTWRIKDKEILNEIRSMYVTADVDRNFIDVVALPTCKDLLEYALKYQLKFFNEEKASRMREWTLGVLTLFNKRSISITRQAVDAVITIIDPDLRLDTFKSNCLNNAHLDETIEEIRYEYLGQVSDATLRNHGFDERYLKMLWFPSTVPPPNMPIISQQEDYSTFTSTTISTKNFQFTCVTSIKMLKQVCKELSSYPIIAVDTETTGIDPYTDSLVGISLSGKDGIAYYIPIGHRKENLPISIVQQELNNILSNKDIMKIFHNAKFDISILNRHGIDIDGYSNIFDTMIAIHSLDSTKRFVTLDRLAKEFFNYEMQPIEEIIGKGNNQQRFDQIPLRKASWYACEDAALTFLIGKQLFSLIQQDAEIQPSFYRNQELLFVLIHMEQQGVTIDIEQAKQREKEAEIYLETIRSTIFEIMGASYNLNSTKDIQILLYEDLGFPIQRKTLKGEPSTDKYVLDTYRHHHYIIPLLIEYRKTYKLIHTFLKNIIQQSSESKKLFTSFNITATATGRLSSSGPNLQQVPKHGSENLRSLFISNDDDYLIGSFDFKQMELVMAAHLSQDPFLLDAYQHEKDIHSLTAAKLFRKSIDAVTNDERMLAKKANFGLLYGMGARNFAREVSYGSNEICLSNQEAKEIRKRFFTGYPQLLPFYENLIADAKHDGYLVTAFGTRRFFPCIHFLVGPAMEKNIREAKNFIIQGTCADILKIVMIQIHNAFQEKELRSRMILSVHDELVFEIYKDEKEMVLSLIQEIMEQSVALRVPLHIDQCIGTYWGDSSIIK